MSRVSMTQVADLGLPTSFPCTYFPGLFETYRRDLVGNTTISADFAAAGMLAALSAAAGNSVVGRLGTMRFIPLSLYQILIGNPGSSKSPALTHTLLALRREQQSRIRAAARLTTEVAEPSMYERAGYGDSEGGPFVGQEADLESQERRPGTVGRVRHLYLTDATVAAIREALGVNPRGLLVAADEAVSLFQGPGKGNDRGIFLQFWNCETVNVARGKTIVSIPRSFVSIVAGTQPDILPSLSSTKGDDGMCDRMLFWGVPTEEWPEYGRCDVDAGVTAAYNHAIDRLIQHRDGEVDDSLASSLVLPFPEPCNAVFEGLHARLVGVLREAQASKRYGGLVSKTIANAQRLTVIRACARWAAEEDRSTLSPDAITIEDAVEACRVSELCLGRALLWRPEIVGSAARLEISGSRSIASAGQTATPTAEDSEALASRIVAYMTDHKRRYSEVEIRKLHSCGGFRGANSSELRAACQTLVDGGRGQWLDEKRTRFGLLASNAAGQSSMGSAASEGGIR